MSTPAKPARGRASGLRAAQAAAKRYANKLYNKAAGRSDCREVWELRAGAKAAWHIGELIDVQAAAVRASGKGRPPGRREVGR